MKNPYLNRGLIRNPKDFYGRKAEIEMIYSRLNSDYPQCVSLKGHRRIGKSSLLYYIFQKEMRKNYLDVVEKYIFAFCDFQELVDIQQEDFFRILFDELSEEIKEKILLPMSYEYIEIRKFIQSLEEQGYKVVFIFDEFDVITQNQAFDLKFFSFLRSIASKYRVAIVTSSQADLQEMCYKKEIKDSPFFNIFTPLTLGSFTKEEALELITKPSQDEGVPLAKFSKFILDIAGFHPFFVQVACSVVFDYVRKHEKLGEDDYEAIQELFLDEIMGHFEYIWANFTEKQQNTLINLIKEIKLDSVDQKTIKLLKQLGYIISKEDKDIIFSSVFEEYIIDKAGIHFHAEAEKLDLEKIKTVSFALNESCRKIIGHLIEQGGEDTQRKMRNNIDMARTTLAHNLNLLVDRGIVKKVKHFYTNVIKFSDEFWH